MVYQDGGNSFKATVQRFNSASWEVVGSAGFSVVSASYTDIALAGDGTPYVVYTDGGNANKATVRRFNGTVWEVVGTAGLSDGAASATNITIDNNGNIIVVYSSTYAYAKSFKIASVDQEAPNISCLANIAQSAGNSCSAMVAIEPPTATDNVSTVFTFEGIRSDGAELDAFFPIGSTTITWTATDEADNVSESCEQLVTVTGTGDCWAQVGPTGFSNGSVVEVSLALDDSGVPYVAFQDNAYENRATVQKFNGSGWEPVGPGGFSAGEANWTSLAFDGSGVPYVAFKDGGNGNRATVQRFNGNGWELVGEVGFSPSAADYVSLALDGSGVPFVAYYDGANGNRTTVQKYNGSEWELVGSAGFSADVAYDISLIVDGSGVPFIAYSDVSNGRKATVQKFNGSTWELVGPAGFSDGEAYWTSLAIDRTGLPYLAYQDVANDHRATVQRFNGSDWVVLGPAGLSPYTGAVSLLLDNSGVPYVAYQDSAKEGKATVQRFNGNAWEVVGNAGFSGGQALFTDLAMDQTGNLYVAYSSPEAFVKKFTPLALADKVVPIITCPTDIVEVAGNECSISVALTDPFATDNVSIVFTFLGIRSDGALLSDPFIVGETIITWTATDEAGNISEPCTQIVTILDLVAPMISCPDDILIMIPNGESSPVNLVAPTGNDNCTGPEGYDDFSDFTGIRNDGLELTDEFPVGTTSITWTSIDESGNNSESCIQFISVYREVSITGFVLVDPLTNQDILELTDGMVINFENLLTDQPTIRANATADTGRVVFDLSGASSAKASDKTLPFSLFGDKDGDYNGKKWKSGLYTLTATAYQANASPSDLGFSSTISFEVITNDKKNPKKNSKSVVVSPNPANESVSILVEDEITISELKVFDIHGRLIHQVRTAINPENYLLETNLLNSGLYFLDIVDQNGIHYQKRLIIKR